MMAARNRKKRAWTPWYRLPIPPLCEDCKLPMISTSTREQRTGLTVQYRKCPQCGKTAVTTYQR